MTCHYPGCSLGSTYRVNTCGKKRWMQTQVKRETETLCRQMTSSVTPTHGELWSWMSCQIYLAALDQNGQVFISLPLPPHSGLPVEGPILFWSWGHPCRNGLLEVIFWLCPCTWAAGPSWHGAWVAHSCVHPLVEAISKVTSYLLQTHHHWVERSTPPPPRHTHLQIVGN
jgi:hypothetical protein